MRKVRKKKGVSSYIDLRLRKKLGKWKTMDTGKSKKSSARCTLEKQVHIQRMELAISLKSSLTHTVNFIGESDDSVSRTLWDIVA